MGFIRERKIKDGSTRFQAEVRLKEHPMQTAVFDRKTDAKAWVQKVEADIRCGRHQLYAERRRHTFAEAVEKYPFLTKNMLKNLLFKDFGDFRSKVVRRVGPRRIILDEEALLKFIAESK